MTISDLGFDRRIGWRQSRQPILLSP